MICNYLYCYTVIFWPFDPAKNAIPRWCTGRKWHILMAVMRGNRVVGNWLMKWDEVKTHIQFFLSHPNQTHTLQKIPKITRICSHFQNKPYKTTSTFLPNLAIPGEQHATRKQNQNRKWIEKTTFFHPVPPYFLESFLFPYH